jgi:hypothetical protein
MARWHSTIFRIPYERAVDMEIARRAREACVRFGVPYAARVLPNYHPELGRLRQGDLPIGCLNQSWSGPLVVWYPEGDWFDINATKEDE